MEEIISKEELNRLMNLRGKVRGDGMKNYAEFVFKEKGEEGLKKLEETMKSLGYPIKYREMRKMEFFPLGLEALTLVLIKQLFNFDDKKFQEMGKFGVKLSIIIKVFMQYFVSPEKLAKAASQMWRKGVTVGELKMVEYNKDKKYLILRLEDFYFHPLHCHIIQGYFLAALQMLLKIKATCQETKCLYRGDEFHEFLLKW